jgi:predicted metal-dependent HD superfamily phosphohydrolase
VLLDAWTAAVADAGGAGGAPTRAAGDALLDRWSEPHRRYHTLDHLAAVLDVLGGDAPSEVRLAAWFHDAVYDPRRADNEEASARLAADVLAGLGVPDAAVAEVTRLVRLTATHDPAADDPAGVALSDADLAILAVPAPAYERYAAAVRAEYAHVPDRVFRAARADELRGLLGRPALYRGAAAFARSEARARTNLAKEVTRLDAATPDPQG